VRVSRKGGGYFPFPAENGNKTDLKKLRNDELDAQEGSLRARPLTYRKRGPTPGWFEKKPNYPEVKKDAISSHLPDWQVILMKKGGSRVEGRGS